MRCVNNCICMQMYIMSIHVQKHILYKHMYVIKLWVIMWQLGLWASHAVRSSVRTSYIYPLFCTWLNICICVHDYSLCIYMKLNPWVLSLQLVLWAFHAVRSSVYTTFSSVVLSTEYLYMCTWVYIVYVYGSQASSHFVTAGTMGLACGRKGALQISPLPYLNEF